MKTSPTLHMTMILVLQDKRVFFIWEGTTLVFQSLYSSSLSRAKMSSSASRRLPLENPSPTGRGALLGRMPLPLEKGNILLQSERALLLAGSNYVVALFVLALLLLHLSLLLPVLFVSLVCLTSSILPVPTYVCSSHMLFVSCEAFGAWRKTS